MTLVATLFLGFCYALSASASLRVKTARTAFVFAAGVVAFLVTVPPLLNAAIRPLYANRSVLWDQLWTWFEALDPVTVLAAFEVDRAGPHPAPPHAVELFVRFLTLYLPVTLMLPVEMVWRFRRIAIRS